MGVPRRKNQIVQEKNILDASTVAAISATASVVLGKMDGDYSIDAFEVTMPGGYTADATNRYTLTLQVGATVMSTIDLTPGDSGNLVDLVVFAKAPTVANGVAGDTLKVVMTKNGTAANIPAGSRFYAKTHLL